jgi:hypothetical protein
MVKHKSGTRWSGDREVRRCCVQSTPCIRRRGACVSLFGLKTKVGGFSGLGLKTDSCGLVIWPRNHRDGFLVYASKLSGLRFVRCVTKPTGG